MWVVPFFGPKVSSDVVWSRKSQRRSSMFVQYQQFGQLQQIIDETSEEAVEPLTVRGVLTAANVTSKTFQFSVEGQEEIRGTFDDAISSSQQVKVPGVYVADIICTSSTSYATDEVKKKNFLKRLSPAE